MVKAKGAKERGVRVGRAEVEGTREERKGEEREGRRFRRGRRAAVGKANDIVWRCLRVKLSFEDLEERSGEVDSKDEESSCSPFAPCLPACLALLSEGATI